MLFEYVTSQGGRWTAITLQLGLLRTRVALCSLYHCNQMRHYKTKW